MKTKNQQVRLDLDFQWKSDTDDPKSFLLRLEELYSKGLKIT